MARNSQSPVAILGAGLTGLAASLRLQELHVPFRLFERTDRVGGHAVTDEDSGFRFDRTGHLLHLRNPAMKDLVLDLLGNKVIEIQRQSRIWSSGVYTRYPFQANTFGLPAQVAYDCLMGYLVAQAQNPRPVPQNFEEFCLAHFGQGFSEHFMLPYNARLWGVHPREIGSAWCERFVPLPRLEDVVAGAVGKNDRELGYNSNFIYPRRGIGALPEAMAARLAPSALELHAAIGQVHWKSRQLTLAGEKVSYQRLISTAPLPVLISRLDNPPPQVAAAAQMLRATPLYYLDVALDAPCQKDFHWIYVPEARYPFYRVGCYSHFSPDLAPQGKASLYVELVTRTPPDLTALRPQVAEALTEMGLISGPDQILFARLRHLAPAYVIYDAAHTNAVATVHGFLKEQGIESTGRYGAWNYSSMEDALLMGREAADRSAAAI